MRSYALVFEKTNTGFSSYAPDLPGCIAAGRTMGETFDLMQTVIQMHIEAMQEAGDSIPEPTTHALETSA